MRDTKQVLIIRKDLNMRKGKMVAQGSHASMLAILQQGHVQKDEHGLPTYVIPMQPSVMEWVTNLFTKVCVGVNSEEELLAIYEQAKEANIPCSLIQDAGLTEFDGVPTYTAVAVGPGATEDIDKITGDLKLL